MGRMHTPTALKVIAGNPGGRKLPQDEPAVVAIEDAEPPEDLLGEDARRKWPEMIAHLTGMRVLSATDLESLRVYCEAYEDSRRAAELIRKHGYVTVGASGQLVRNPAQTVVEKARAEMMLCLKHFGMTPASRSTVATIPNVGAADGWDDI